MDCITGDEVFFPENEIKRLSARLWILDYLPKNSVGCELGVFRGHFSEKIIEKINPQIYFMVDPWRLLGKTFNWRNPHSEYLGHGSLTTQYAYDDACRRISRFIHSNDIRVVENFSQKFLSTIDIKFDFFYLDTTHTYNQTTLELGLMDTLLSKDGIIAGDDWNPLPKHVHHGVFRAVNEFIKVNDYQLVASGPAGQWAIRRTPQYSA